jgi:hypothetical protein
MDRLFAARFRRCDTSNCPISMGPDFFARVDDSSSVGEAARSRMAVGSGAYMGDVATTLKSLSQPNKETGTEPTPDIPSYLTEPRVLSAKYNGAIEGAILLVAKALGANPARHGVRHRRVLGAVDIGAKAIESRGPAGSAGSRAGRFGRGRGVGLRGSDETRMAQANCLFNSVGLNYLSATLKTRR